METPASNASFCPEAVATRSSDAEMFAEAGWGELTCRQGVSSIKIDDMMAVSTLHGTYLRLESQPRTLGMETSPKSLVERFYFEVWNCANERVAREILHPEFRFRASLGPEKHGPDGFIEYMRSIHAALADYNCVIDDLITTENRAAARMTFRGRHRGRFFDVEPTGKEIRWTGGAFFVMDGKQIVELWVLGDVDSVKHQLSANRGAAFG